LQNKGFNEKYRGVKRGFKSVFDTLQHKQKTRWTEKELKVRIPCEAVKSWFDIEPEIFKILPDEFYTIALNGMVQCGET